MTLSDLNKLFPKHSEDRTCARTGLIPMSFFLAHEKEIAEVVQQNRLRRIYRGPRRHLYTPGSMWHDLNREVRHMTLKGDATGVRLYSRG